MANNQLRIVIIYMLIFGLYTFALGRRIGIEQQTNKNDELMQKTIEYKWLYEDCQTMFGDYQDRVEAERNKEVNK